jgi:hypothetical protein
MKTALIVIALFLLAGLAGRALKLMRNRHFHRIERRLNDAATHPYYAAARMNLLRAEIGWRS